jgi:CheY-like chemotaxis protein
MQSSSRQRILLVDPDAQARHAIALMLQALKAVVVQAEDGIEALSLYARRPFDIVLTEYDLLGMKGDELARDLKPFDSHLRVILITNYAQQVRLKRREHPFIDDFLLKPCNLRQLAFALGDPRPAASPGGCASGTATEVTGLHSMSVCGSAWQPT